MTDETTIKRPGGASPLPVPEGVGDAVTVPAPPTPVAPLDGIPEARRRELLGEPLTEAQQAEQQLVVYKEQQFVAAARLATVEDQGYPEGEIEFHRMRLHGHLLIAQADVEQTEARIKKLRAEAP